MPKFAVEKLSDQVTYPVYRKYKNNSSYFRILSSGAFDEVRVLGDKYYLHHFEAKILPDRNLIHDLTFDYGKYCDVITREEFEVMLKKAEK